MRARVRASVIAALSVVSATMFVGASASAGGNASVNEFYGSYGKDVPIEVPGFRGIEPKLALSYSSGGRNRLAGAGWDLSGFTIVERKGKGGAAPRYNSTDEYYIDGQLLIPCTTGMVSPSCSTGGNYTTEIESYTRISFANDKWTITSRDGTKIELAAIMPGPGGAFRWGIDKVTDTNSNVVDYGWSCDPIATSCTPLNSPLGCDPSCVGGQQCEYDYEFGEEFCWPCTECAQSCQPVQSCYNEPAACDPTCVGGQHCYNDPYVGQVCSPCTSCTGQTCLDKTQECYPDTVTYSDVTVKVYTEARSDEVKFPIGGWMGKTKYRVRSIKVSVGSSLLRAYKLAYSTSASSRRSLLASVQQFGTDATVSSTGVISGGTSLPPITFGYQSSVATFATATNFNSRALFGNDGDARPSWGTGNYTNLIDMNGDGILDFVAHHKYIGATGAGLWVALGTGTGFSSPINWYSASKLGNAVHGRPSYNSSGTAYSTLLDMNRDGRPDYVSYYRHSTGQYGMWVLINTGTGFNNPVNWNTRGLFNRNEAAYPSWNSDNYTQLRDMNGDGYPDFISYYNWNVSQYGMWVAINNNGTGFLTPTNWGTRAKLGHDVHARPKYTDSGDTRNDLVDMNGDGLPDYVAYYNHLTATYGLWVLLNTGSGFENPVNWNSKGKLGNSQNGSGFPGWGHGNYTALRDVTGDGLPDFLAHRHYGYSGTSSYGLWVLENNGSGFENAVNWYTRSKLGNDVHARPNYNDGSNTFTDLVDMNNDGLLDFVSYHNHVTGTAGMWVLFNNGKGFENPVNWYSGSKMGDNNNGRPQWSEYAGLRDVDGDGLPDYVSYKRYTTWGLWVAKNTGVKPDLLTSVNNGLGGSTTVAYTHYSASDDTYMPEGLHVDVVSSITSNDGQGNAATVSYTYGGALFDAVKSRFLGFRYVKATSPCITGESQCPYTESWFKQDYGSVSKPERTDERDGSGKLLSSTVHNYTTNGATLPHTSVETSIWEYVYDGSGTTCSSWPCTTGSRAYVTRTFDTYGNITKEVTYGDYDASGDEKTVSYNYYPNTSAFIVSSPGMVSTYAGTTTAGTLLSRVRIVYDTRTSYTQTPLLGKPTKTERWLNSPSSYVTTKAGYDAWGNVIWEENELGHRTTFTIDTVYRKYITALKNPLNQTTTSCSASSPGTCYDLVCGAPKLIKDLNGQTTTKQYDALCRQTRVDNAGGGYVTKSYNNFGDADCTVGSCQYTEERGPAPDASGEAWTRSYFDGLGRVWRTEAKGPSGTQTIIQNTEYNARGAEARKTAPYYTSGTPQWLTVTYDQRDRPIRITQADGTYVTKTYGLSKVTTSDELGAMTEDTLDSRGLVTRHREWNGSTAIDVTHTYDASGRKTQTLDPKGNKWTFTYDSLGRITSARDPDMGTVTKTYDAAGRLVDKWDAKGQRTSMTYDAASRMKTKTTYLASGAVERTVTINYDQARAGYYNLGRKTSMTDPSGTTTSDYDTAGRLVKWTRSIDGTTYTSKSTFDLGGRLLGVKYPDGDVIGKNPDTGTGTPITYDGAGRMKTLPGYVSNATYTAWGALATQTNVNGTVITRTHNLQRMWINNISTVKGATTIQNLTYGRDAEGKVTSVTSPFANESWNYTYDNRDQLKSATNTSSSSYNQTFAYDTIGNMTSNSQIGSYTYPASGATSTRPHAVATAGSNSYAYDASGNQTSGAGRTISWNVDNMPGQVTSGGTSSYYTYDGTNQRIKKVVSGVTTIRLGDGYEVTGGVVTKYFSFAGAVVAKKVGSTKSWLHTDVLGTVQTMTNSSGSEVLRRKFKPFGSTLSSSGSGSEKRGFVGQELDETGLVYMNARYYDPVLGRFISADPIASASQTLRLNRYAYAGNNPINNTDIDGLSWLSKAWKKVKNFFKKVGRFLLKIAGVIARIPIIGSIVAKPLQFWGAVFTGNWKMAIRIVATVIISAIAQVLTVMTAGIASPLLYVMARGAIGFAEGYMNARVMGASGSEAMKAGLVAGAFSAASAAVGKFKEAKEAKKAAEAAAAEQATTQAASFADSDGGAQIILVHNEIKPDGSHFDLETGIEFTMEHTGDINSALGKAVDEITGKIQKMAEEAGSGFELNVVEKTEDGYFFAIIPTDPEQVAMSGHVSIEGQLARFHIIINRGAVTQTALTGLFGGGGIIKNVLKPHGFKKFKITTPWQDVYNIKA